MNRREILAEIEVLKIKIAFEPTFSKQMDFLTALLALYESVVAHDNKLLEDALLVEWKSVFSDEDALEEVA